MDHSLADDAALRALFWPFQTDELTLSGRPVLFLGARPGFWAAEHPSVPWRCEQPFLPWADELRARGLDARPQVDEGGFAMTLVLPPRQREEARWLLARAVRATAEGGVVVMAAGNAEGARSLESDLQTLVGGVRSLSKHKSRVVWAHIDPARVDASKLAEWLVLGEPRELDIAGRRCWTRPGLFAWDRVDPASALLAAQWPPTLSGRVADLGAGWGYLSLRLIGCCPNVTGIDLFEANARALEPARRNLAAALGGRDTPTCAVHWHDVSAGLPGRYDLVVSNPPFHIGRADAPQLGRAFIRAAADSLEANGQAWIVANRHLPYEALLRERFAQVTMPVQQGGYKVFHACGPKR